MLLNTELENMFDLCKRERVFCEFVLRKKEILLKSQNMYINIKLPLESPITSVLWLSYEAGDVVEYRILIIKNC